MREDLRACLDRTRKDLDRGPWELAQHITDQCQIRDKVECFKPGRCSGACCFGNPDVLSGEVPLIAARLMDPHMGECLKRVMQMDLLDDYARCPLQDPESMLCEVYDIRPYVCRIYMVVLQDGGACGTTSAGLVRPPPVGSEPIILMDAGTMFPTLQRLLGVRGVKFDSPGLRGWVERNDHARAAGEKKRQKLIRKINARHAQRIAK